MAVKAKAEITLASVRDVKSTTRYYLLQSSTASKPAMPTANPPGGNWVKTEPSYTSGSTNSLYFTDLTVFSDDTFAYSDVSLGEIFCSIRMRHRSQLWPRKRTDTSPTAAIPPSCRSFLNLRMLRSMYRMERDIPLPKPKDRIQAVISAGITGREFRWSAVRNIRYPSMPE